MRHRSVHRFPPATGVRERPGIVGEIARERGVQAVKTFARVRRAHRWRVIHLYPPGASLVGLGHRIGLPFGRLPAASERLRGRQPHLSETTHDALSFVGADGFPLRVGGVGATNGNRTRDLLDHNQVLCRLSYRRHVPVEPGGPGSRAVVARPNRRRRTQSRASAVSKTGIASSLPNALVYAEGGRVELPRAFASTVFKTVPVAIFRVGPPMCAGRGENAPARRCSGGTRTRDRRIMSAELYQLSYGALTNPRRADS